jgi:hypothetical protein
MDMEQMIALAERRGEKEYADILKGKDTAGPNIIGDREVIGLTNTLDIANLELHIQRVSP